MGEFSIWHWLVLLIISGVGYVVYRATHPKPTIPTYPQRVEPRDDRSHNGQAPTTDHATQAAYKPSDVWLMKIWVYIILPIVPLGILGSSFFGEKSSGTLNGEQFIFVVICTALIYGLHKKQKWAWFVNWIGILALAAIPLKYGVTGGVLGGLWIWWNYLAWNRLKQCFH